MSAIPTHASAAPPVERRADPSMEDVLASIRKIIADEDAAHSRAPIDPIAPTPRPQPVTPPPSASILTPSAVGGRTWGTTPPPIPRPIQPPFSFSRPAPVVEPMQEAPPAAAPPPTSFAAPMPAPLVAEVPVAPILAPPVEEDVVLPPAAVSVPAELGALLSEATTDSITSAFQALTASVAITKTEVIDKHVRDMLRPMLRTWLDDNLPSIVEKLVRLEIERVARGGR